MKKILIVDDQVEVRELIEVTLKSDRYQIIQAKNGKEAIEIANKVKPDLIFMDIMMYGGIDGLEATRRLKSNPETKNSIIIMLTAKCQKEDYKKGFDAGADDYFAKPFSPLRLIKKVEEILK